MTNRCEAVRQAEQSLFSMHGLFVEAATKECSQSFERLQPLDEIRVLCAVDAMRVGRAIAMLYF